VATSGNTFNCLNLLNSCHCSLPRSPSPHPAPTAAALTFRICLISLKTRGAKWEKIKLYSGCIDKGKDKDPRLGLRSATFISWPTLAHPMSEVAASSSIPPQPSRSRPRPHPRQHPSSSSPPAYLFAPLVSGFLIFRRRWCCAHFIVLGLANTRVLDTAAFWHFAAVVLFSYLFYFEV